MIMCPFCTTEAPDGARTCTNCGKPFDTAAEAPAAGEAGLSPCPQCKAAWKPGAVLCVACGYDARVGRPLSTVRGVEEPPAVVRPTTGFGPVPTGLLLHRIGVCLWLLSIPLGLILEVQKIEVASLMATGSETGVMRGPLIAALVMLITLVAFAICQWVLGMLGSVLCLWLPRESGAQGWLIASLALGVLMVAAGASVVWYDWPALLLTLVWLPSWFAWMMSMRNVAYYLGRRDEAQEAVGIVVHVLLAVLVIPEVGFRLLAFAVLWLMSLQSFECLAAVVAVAVGLVAFVAWLYYYVRVLFSLFRMIATVRGELLPRPAVDTV